ncbi:hypothetical protein [Sinorhizobium meliloti]|uniref:hypothetical protein n=1 Tax=Rhizobium meliloti TaxID=382 RepID=UPI001296F073|nr:hypothetical protein [Sinorhizobium meliloti]MQX28962.1 hypothetical protein [Sinorhizobium meliloti]
MSEPWLVHGPDFNQWNGDLKRLVDLLHEAADDPWWCYDSQLKYISIWVDTRDNGFVLKDRDGNRISPERVEAAINKWRESFR